MHIHILGICGTFMGSLAVLAKELGHRVTGSDANVYPPMSTQLEAQGIELMQGYDPAHLQPAPDLVVVGNAMSRGNPAVEYVLNKGLPLSLIHISALVRWLEQQGTHVVVEQAGDLDTLDHAAGVALQRAEIIRLARFQTAGLEGLARQAQGIGGLLENQPEHR